MSFYSELNNADSEKLVEGIYHEYLKKGLHEIGGKVIGIRTFFGTDGVLDGTFDFEGTPRILRVIIETKFNETFEDAMVRSKVLIQVLYYLRKFDGIGEQVPNVVLVGDKDECFVLHSNSLNTYIDKNLDWSIAPSLASSRNQKLIKEMAEDTELQSECFVFVIDEDFEFAKVIKKIVNLATDTKTKVRITEKSVSKVFDYFTLRILKRSAKGKSSYTPRQQVEYFMQLVLNSDDCYIHPKKKNKAVFNEVTVDVNSSAFESFVKHYKFEYNAKEKRSFTEICDRLIEDSDRRRKGDFYTPSIWADEAHKMISENLGDDWKEKYMVWNCAWGTGNLTRDYQFADLYCSTLYEHDLTIGGKYNPEAKAKFQYDFLNDDVEHLDMLLLQVKMGYKLSEKDFYGTKLWKLAPGLIQGLLTGKKLLFFINPPYGTANTLKEITGTSKSKSKMASTKINTLMKTYKIGASSQQLYAQFFFRIVTFAELGFNISLGVFSSPLYLTSSLFKGLRSKLENSFSFLDGMLLQASHFADVSTNWGISFTLWSSLSADHVGEFNLMIKTIEAGGVLSPARKKFYSIGGATASDWIKENIKDLEGSDSPQMRNAISWHKEPKWGTKLNHRSLGYYVNVANNVNENAMNVFLLSSCAYKGHGIYVLENNYFRVISNFTARKLITGQYSTWVNSKDEYKIPDTTHYKYQEWNNDCIVYSLFNIASNQSSLRNIDYNNKQWNIYNHFFFMSREEIEGLALGEYHNDEVYEDLIIHAEDERFVYKKLQQVSLSPDAQSVLSKARQLVRDSFKYREIFNQEHPEYHINTWDAGWYQIKGMLKKYMPEELKEFNSLYKAFEDRMRPLVVELGFLYDYPGYEKTTT